MKKRRLFVLSAILVVSMMVMASCSGIGSLAISADTEKSMTVEAEKSNEGDEVMTGGLEVAAGEQVVVTAGLDSGEIKIELFAEPADQSEEELPDFEGLEPAMMFNAAGTDSQTGTLPEGNYYVKVSTTEKANGTVQIEVKAAE